MARGFVFRLETLLRVRATREREVKRQLAEAKAEMLRLDELDSQTRAAIVAHQDILTAMQEGIVQPLELARGRAWILHLQRELADRTPLRHAAAQRISKVQADLREARQQTRMIEKLRERRWIEHRLEQGRREQHETDDVAQRLRFVQSAEP